MDIVERLRGYDENDLVYKTDMIEAAYEIERLREALDLFLGQMLNQPLLMIPEASGPVINVIKHGENITVFNPPDVTITLKGICHE